MIRYASIALTFVCLAPASINQTIASAASSQVGVTTIYDPSYVALRYPGGDLPAQRGVCADVVIRAFRKAGIDLQREVHEDMRRNFAVYPRKWGLRGTDTNIDHRRVPNLMTFFTRRGKNANAAFEPGDVVAWRLSGGLYHIGIVAPDVVPGTARHYMIHNIGNGAQKEDVLNAFAIIGHYRW
jgi:uncharacterized protein YijF (DUF1287 family)